MAGYMIKANYVDRFELFWVAVRCLSLINVSLSTCRVLFPKFTKPMRLCGLWPTLNSTKTICQWVWRHRNYFKWSYSLWKCLYYDTVAKLSEANVAEGGLKTYKYWQTLEDVSWAFWIEVSWWLRYLCIAVSIFYLYLFPLSLIDAEQVLSEPSGTSFRLSPSAMR